MYLNKKACRTGKVYSARQINYEQNKEAGFFNLILFLIRGMLSARCCLMLVEMPIN